VFRLLGGWGNSTIQKLYTWVKPRFAWKVVNLCGALLRMNLQMKL